ncbi:MAG: hypothetical protein Q7L55_10320 [Actinomycetota bacterium]|nr:hypothetical protein [Actinomycetota bacterium]
MPKRLILHVGLPKCGSTSLQDGFARSTEILAAHDVSFVRLRPTKLVQTLASGQRPRLWPDIIGEDPAEVVILSSEFLCTLDPAGIDGLMNGIAHHFDSITVVFVLRLLEDWTLSRMNQRAQALPARPSQQKSEQLDVQLDVGDLDVWLNVWSTWAYEQSAERDIVLLPLVGEEPLAQRFLAALGLAHVEFDPQALGMWSNRSVSTRALDLIEITRKLGDLLSARQGLDSIRSDAESYDYIKRIIALAKQWDRPVDERPSPKAVREANKAAGRLRLALEETLEEPLRSEVLALVGTRAASRRARKIKAAEVAATD